MAATLWGWIALAAVVVLGGYWMFALGRLRGTKETMHEITRGTSAHYEREGEPIPKDINELLDRMIAQVRKTGGAPAKRRAYAVYMHGLGAKMGEACWLDGYKIGYAMAHCSTGNRDVDSGLAHTLRMTTGCTDETLASKVRAVIPQRR